MADNWFKRKMRGWLGVESALPARAESKPHAARTIYGSTQPRPTLTEKQAQHQEQVNETLRLAMLGVGPGWWASDHAEEAQHFTSWNYCAIHSKAKQAAQATLRVYHRTPKKPDSDTLSKSTTPDQQEYDRTPLPANHELVRLFEKPNPRWSASLFRYQIIQQLDLTGSALIWKVKDRGSKLRELWVIPTGLARPQMPSKDFPFGAYWVTATGLFTLTGGLTPMPTGSSVGSAAGMLIDARDIHPIRWPHAILMADGQSPLNAGSFQTDLAEEIDQAAWAALNNIVDPSVILSLDATMQADETEIDRIEAKIGANRAGSNNRGKFWLMQGVDPKQVHRSPAELDYADSRGPCRDGVFAIQGVSGTACGIPAATGTYSGYYVQLQQTIELTVQPEFDLVASEFTRMLHEETGDEALEVQITAKSFNDPDVMDKKRQASITAKSITINEDRKAQGLEPVDWGEVQVGTPVPAHLISPEFFPEPEPALPGGGPPGAGGGKPTDDSTGIKKPAPSMRDKLNGHMLNGFHLTAEVNA